MADGEGTESGTGTESSAESSQTQSETRTEQTGGSGGNDAVAASLDALNSTVKGLGEMVAKLPETLANLVKVEEKTDPPKTEGTPGQEPPKEQTEEPKDTRNAFQRWFYGK